MWPYHMILLNILSNDILTLYQTSFIYYKTRTNLAARFAIAEYWNYNRYETI